MSDTVVSDPELAEVINAADTVLSKYRDKPPLPPMLFQYTSLDAALKIIGTRKVWCSNLRHSNDPSEAVYGKQLLDDVLTNDPDLKLQGLRTVVADLDPYAASFSADGDLLPQWRAYCRNGRGVALGLEFETLRQRKSMILVRVLYDEPEQRHFITAMLDVFRVPLLAARGNVTKLDPLVRKLALYLAIIRSALKSTAYESEREYRLLDLLPRKLDMAHAGLDFRVSGGLLVPFLVADLTQSQAQSAQEPISEVRVGPCLDYSLLQASFSLYCDQNARTLNVSRSNVSIRCE